MKRPALGAKRVSLTTVAVSCLAAPVLALEARVKEWVAGQQQAASGP